MKTLFRAVSACAIATVLAGCASNTDLVRMRQQPMPTTAVAKASRDGPYYHNIFLQSVEGAPEFVLVDGNGLINSRPTRRHMTAIFNEDLDNADMLGASRLDSDLALYVKVEQITGPTEVPFTDKLTSARVTFKLVRWRTGAVVRQKTEEAHYVARFPGVAPETVRYVVENTLAGAAAGAVDGLAVRYGMEAYKEAGGGGRIDWSNVRDSVKFGAWTGAEVGAAESIILSLFDEGFVQPVGARKGAYLSDVKRINYASNEVIHLLMDKFLHDLATDGSIVFKQAVSCQSLNPGKFAYPISETADAYGVDCPGAHYTSDRLLEVDPSNFS